MRPVTVSVPKLADELRKLLAGVPAGSVTTYGNLAKALGDSRAARWVATELSGTLASHPAAHRVVTQAGVFNSRLTAAAAKLQAEGIPVEADRVADSVRRVAAEDLIGTRSGTSPLGQLVEEQHRLAGQVLIEPLAESPHTVAGIDLSYSRNGMSVGAYVLMRVGDAAPLWHCTAAIATGFPYIPTYLTFRELPVHAELLRLAVAEGKVADLLMVDGSGILHPRRVGSASHLGVLADHPTVGVTKHKLTGTLREPTSLALPSQWVDVGDECRGAAFTATRSKKPVFVSPGHRCSVTEAAEIAVLCWKGHRVPEPIFWADKISREAARVISAANGAAAVPLEAEREGDL